MMRLSHHLFCAHFTTPLLDHRASILLSVHLIASIDHVNAPLLWDFALLDRFGWVWHDVTSFAPYRLETAFAPAVVGAQTLEPRGDERDGDHAADGCEPDGPHWSASNSSSVYGWAATPSTYSMASLSP